MAVETYNWRSQLGAGVIEYSQTVRSVQFGDGYEQVAENGINSTAIQVPMKHTGAEAEVNAVRDFLLAHTVKAFIITLQGKRRGFIASLLILYVKTR
jgi:phage-related protein